MTKRVVLLVAVLVLTGAQPATRSAAHADVGDFAEAIQWVTKAMAMDNQSQDLRSEMLELYRSAKPYRGKH